MFEIKPKTRKEIYMAYLAGNLSLELPEPMTRDEVTLYNLCQSHAYGSTTTVKEVLAECQPVFNNTMQGCLIGHGQEMALAVGETYIVTMDGKEYTTIPAVDMTTMGDERMWVGLINEGANLETGEGLVFTVMSFVPEFAAGVKCPGMVRTMDGSVPSTISIRQEVTTVTKLSGKYVEGMGYEEDGTIHPIDPKYLPSGGGEFVVTFTEDDEGFIADKSHSELVTANESNVYIRAVFDYGGGRKDFYRLANVSFYEDSFQFVFHNHAAEMFDDGEVETSEQFIFYTNNEIKHHTTGG